MTCVMYFFGYKSFDVVKIKNVLLNLTYPSSNSFLNFAELTKLGFEYFLKQFQRCKKKVISTTQYSFSYNEFIFFKKKIL